MTNSNPYIRKIITYFSSFEMKRSKIGKPRVSFYG